MDTNNSIAIVGGGISGLYTAWRLLDAGYPADKITLYESADHVGGRLLTVNPENLLEGQYDGSIPDATHCELGGMRIPKGYDNYVKRLVHHFDLETEKFPTDNNNNWHYLRGTTQQTIDFNDPDNYPEKVPFRLSEEELKAITRSNAEQDTVGIEGPISEAFFKNKQILLHKKKPAKGGPNVFEWVSYVLGATVNFGSGETNLSSLGFSDLLNNSGQHGSPYPWNLSNEYYQFLTSAGGYDTEEASWNAAAAAAVILANFGPGSDFITLKQGFRQLPATLASEIAKYSTNIIHTQHTAISLAPTPTGGVELGVQTAEGTNLSSYDQVILALPPVAVKSLLRPFFDTTPNLAYNLGQVTPVPAVKMYLMYPQDNDGKAWWERLGLSIEQYTRMTTDLPIRQVYHFGTYTGNGKKSYSVLQISYEDGLTPGYWAGLLADEENKDLNTGLYGNTDSSTPPEIPYLKNFPVYQQASDNTTFMNDYPVFAVAHEQWVNFVNQIPTLSDGEADFPVAGGIVDWGLAPYGGAWNFWNVNVDVRSQYYNLMQPIPDAPIFVQGEGYSLLQGWAEGAIWTAEAILVNHLQVGASNHGWKPPFDVHAFPQE